MLKAAILGAGATGLSLASTLAEAEWDVNLWGTWLDDHLINATEEGRPHPRINVTISDKVRPFRSAGLEDALDGVDAAVASATSQGVPKVTEIALLRIAKARVLWLTSEGFMLVDGKILPLPDGIRSIAKAADVELPPIVVIAGPAKVNECAAGKPTAAISGHRSRDVTVEFACAARSEHHCIEATDDEVGVEIRVPMKNTYAVTLGAVDGLEKKTGKSHHNLKAVTFNEAVREMSILSTALGVDPATAYGLPGIGDLEVTGLSGRNKVYGVCTGCDEGAKGVLQAITELEWTVEGASTLPLVISLVGQSAPQIKDRLPLLYVAWQIVEGDVPDYAAVLAWTALPPKP